MSKERAIEYIKDLDCYLNGLAEFLESKNMKSMMLKWAKKNCKQALKELEEEK